ncbi:MAG TPA: GNAT family N-acetyltransferase [Candidatus Nanopelagicales bacterium]
MDPQHTEGSDASIAVLDPSMMDRATETLTAAFLDDVMFRWVFPESQARARGLRPLNRVPLEFGLRYGVVRQSHGGGCVAIWVPPGQMSLGRMIRCGLLTVPLRTGLGPMARFAGANGVMDTIHKRHMRGPHWELLIVAVDPALQGGGHGTALLREGLARVDASGLPCYLATNTPANLPFYERLGFTVLEEASLGRGGPPAWAMRRPPAGQVVA